MIPRKLYVSFERISFNEGGRFFTFWICWTNLTCYVLDIAIWIPFVKKWIIFDILHNGRPMLTFGDTLKWHFKRLKHERGCARCRQ